jgi:hypothetical protein
MIQAKFCGASSHQRENPMGIYEFFLCGMGSAIVKTKTPRAKEAWND